jgi:hypothetical protein
MGHRTSCTINLVDLWGVEPQASHCKCVSQPAGKPVYESGTASRAATKRSSLFPDRFARVSLERRCKAALLISRTSSHQYGISWCDREDSNLHPFQDKHLKLARLPISPRSHVSRQTCICLPSPTVQVGTRSILVGTAGVEPA